MKTTGLAAQEAIPRPRSVIYRDFPLHHSLPDWSILVSLPHEGGASTTSTDEEALNHSQQKHHYPSNSGGFGRLTREMLGGDALAEALLKDFARRDMIPSILTRHRNPQGYRLLTLRLEEAWSALQTYPIPVRSLVWSLVRKHALKRLGNTTESVVAKSTEEGLVVQLPPHRSVGIEVLSPQRRLPSFPSNDSGMKVQGRGSSLPKNMEPVPRAGDEVEVRVINYNVEAKVFNVTTDPEVVGGTPLHAEITAMALNTLQTGDLVWAKVLLSSTDDGCAVVSVRIPSVDTTGEINEPCSRSPLEYSRQISGKTTSASLSLGGGGATGAGVGAVGGSSLQSHPVERNRKLYSSMHERVTKTPCQLIGYYLYDWENGAGERRNSSASRMRLSGSGPSGVEPPAIGSEILVRVELVATGSSSSFCALQDVLPFLILSSRVGERAYSSCPPVRQCTASSSPSSSLISPPTATPTVSSMKALMKTLANSSHASRDKAAILRDGLMGMFLWRDPTNGVAGKKRVKAGDTASDDDSDCDEEEHEGEKESKSSRLRKRKVEEAIDTYERSMEKATPSSPEEYQRLLLASPNSSYLWTQWMAFHLQLHELESARQVAEKAITTISPREEEEQLNVWVAYMNLENIFGTGESLNTVFKRALPRQSDPLVLYERLADIFEASRKSQQLLSLCRTMTSKWGHRASTWERLGKVLISQNKRDQLKRMIKEMGERLRKPDMAMVVVRLAAFEYKQGTVENGRALFEGLIVKMPKKSDIWMAFIDQEVGLFAKKAPQASLGSVRHLLDRASSVNFNPNAMQMIFAKYMNFEKLHGTSVGVEKVKELARKYVDSKIQAGAQTAV